MGCPGRGKGFHPAASSSSHLQLGRLPSASRVGREVSSWSSLSFPTQGELSVPCCLLTICNRCKYLLLINSLKEMQRWCVGGNSVVEGPWCRAGSAGCSSPALAAKAKALYSLGELEGGCCEDALDVR